MSVGTRPLADIVANGSSFSQPGSPFATFKAPGHVTAPDGSLARVQLAPQQASSPATGPDASQRGSNSPTTASSFKEIIAKLSSWTENNPPLTIKITHELLNETPGIHAQQHPDPDSLNHSLLDSLRHELSRLHQENPGIPFPSTIHLEMPEDLQLGDRSKPDDPLVKWPAPASSAAPTHLDAAQHVKNTDTFAALAKVLAEHYLNTGKSGTLTYDYPPDPPAGPAGSARLTRPGPYLAAARMVKLAVDELLRAKQPGYSSKTRSGDAPLSMVHLYSAQLAMLSTATNQQNTNQHDEQFRGDLRDMFANEVVSPVTSQSKTPFALQLNVDNAEADPQQPTSITNQVTQLLEQLTQATIDQALIQGKAWIQPRPLQISIMLERPGSKASFASDSDNQASFFTRWFSSKNTHQRGDQTLKNEHDKILKDCENAWQAELNQAIGSKQGIEAKVKAYLTRNDVENNDETQAALASQVQKALEQLKGKISFRVDSRFAEPDAAPAAASNATAANVDPAAQGAAADAGAAAGGAAATQQQPAAPVGHGLGSRP